MPHCALFWTKVRFLGFLLENRVELRDSVILAASGLPDSCRRTVTVLARFPAQRASPRPGNIPEPRTPPLPHRGHTVVHVGASQARVVHGGVPRVVW